VRFVISGEWSRNSLLRVIVLCFLFYTFILWVTNAGMYFAKMGLTPSSVVDYYRGNEDRYLQPRSLQGLLEVLHFHAFAMGMLLMTLTHLLLFVPISMRIKAWGIATAFITGITGEVAGWAVRFVHPLFAYLKIASFLALEGVLLWLMVLVARALLIRAPSAYTEGAQPPRPLT
jgi:hypothetical protein